MSLDLRTQILEEIARITQTRDLAVRRYTGPDYSLIRQCNEHIKLLLDKLEHVDENIFKSPAVGAMLMFSDAMKSHEQQLLKHERQAGTATLGIVKSLNILEALPKENKKIIANLRIFSIINCVLSSITLLILLF